MTHLTIEAWAAIGVVIALSVVGSLYVLASIVRDASRRIELYERVFELRLEYSKRTAELAARGYSVDNFKMGGFEIVENSGKKAA